MIIGKIFAGFEKRIHWKVQIFFKNQKTFSNGFKTLREIFSELIKHFLQKVLKDF